MLELEYINLSTKSRHFKIQKYLMESRIIFLQFELVRSSYNLKQISSCYDRSDALSYDELRVVSSPQIVILHRTSSGRQLK